MLTVPSAAIAGNHFQVFLACGQGRSVPSSLQRMNMEGVIYRPLSGNAKPRALLSFATRRGDVSAVVKLFVDLVRKAAKHYPR